MFADLGLSVLVADLDPEANLSSLFLDENSLEEIWSQRQTPRTILGGLMPLVQGSAEGPVPWIARIAPGIGLLVGDLALSARLEDALSLGWLGCVDDNPNAFRVITAIGRLLAKAAHTCQADVVLIDVASNLGALNRATLIAADQVVIPLVPDLTSLQGLNHLGPTLRGWRDGWQERSERLPETLRGELLPGGPMEPVGYVMLQHPVRLDRPVKAYQRWLDQVPARYAKAVLNQPAPPNPNNDPHCLAYLRHHRSLMPLALEAHKPMFHLNPADGALGGHLKAVRECRKEFRELASRLAVCRGLVLS
jgi:cellulose biosynthesis protein BcsQ